jgi:hypothetical protein
MQSQSPPPMDPELFNRVVELTEPDLNIAQILNRDSRSVFQHTFVSSADKEASNLFISGILYALNTYQQLSTPVYVVFTCTNHGLPMFEQFALSGMKVILNGHP